MAGFFDPKVTSHLISDQGEIVIDEVHKHPMANLPALGWSVLTVLALIGALEINVHYVGLPLVAAAVFGLIAAHRILTEHMDRFVITNMRVFRVHGIFSQQRATMPMSRILDITVDKPFVGRIFNYGHFVFETAAQDQGLRVIRFVARPDERDLTIQRVIQRSGLRSSMVPERSERVEYEEEYEVEDD